MIPSEPIGDGLEKDLERAHQRVCDSVTHAKIVRAVEASIGFLSVDHLGDVSDFLVYRSFLTARARAIAQEKPIPTFENFLVTFLERRKNKASK